MRTSVCRLVASRPRISGIVALAVALLVSGYIIFLTAVGMVSEAVPAKPVRYPTETLLALAYLAGDTIRDTYFKDPNKIMA